MLGGTMNPKIHIILTFDWNWQFVQMFGKSQRILIFHVEFDLYSPKNFLLLSWQDDYCKLDGREIQAKVNEGY